MATRFIDVLDSGGNVLDTFTETDDTVFTWNISVIFPTLSDTPGTYTFRVRTPETGVYTVNATATVPTITASDSLTGRTVTISVDTVTGNPAPSTTLTSLTLDGVDVLGGQTGTGPWTYTAPSSGSVQNVAWAVTASNSEGTDTASGAISVPSATATAPAQMSAPTLTGNAGSATLTLATPEPDDGGSAITLYNWEVDAAAGDFSAPVKTGTQLPFALGDPIEVPALPAGDYKARSWAVNAEGSGTPSPASATATVAAGTGFLDSFPGAARAYSLQALTSVVTDVVRVRRSSDDAERDFTATEVTDGTLVSWVGTAVGDNGFVRRLYDQLGSGEDAGSNDSNGQGKIVEDGVLLTDNGNPYVDLSQSSARLFYSNGFTNIYDSAVITVSLKTQATAKDWIAVMSTSSGDFWHGYTVDCRYWNNSTPLTASVGSTNIVVSNSDSGSWSHRQNGTQIDSGTNADTGAKDPSATVSLGTYPTASETGCGIFELIVYDTAQTKNLPAMETDIANRYGVTI